MKAGINSTNTLYQTRQPKSTVDYWISAEQVRGKERSNFLTNLQTSLVLNTFRQNIYKIVQLHKNSHKLLETPS